jgi:altronate dehydratase
MYLDNKILLETDNKTVCRIWIKRRDIKQMKKRALKMGETDNVATVLMEIDPGEEIEILSPDGVVVDKISAIQTIPFGYKISLDHIPEGGNIYKYAALIGRSICEIKKGAMVHIHNITSNRVNIPRERVEVMAKSMGL